MSEGDGGNKDKEQSPYKVVYNEIWHLVMVKYNDEYRIAQYGKYDGNPKIAGFRMLNFIRNADMDIFKKALLECTYYSLDELIAVQDKVLFTTSRYLYDMTNPYYHVGYVASTDILSLVYGNKINSLITKATGVRKLVDNAGFAALGIICEYCWLLDLDTNTFECYVSNETKTLTKEDRFYDANLCTIMGSNTIFIPSLIFGSSKLTSEMISTDPKDPHYQPVKIYKSWKLSELPKIYLRTTRSECNPYYRPISSDDDTDYGPEIFYNTSTDKRYYSKYPVGYYTNYYSEYAYTDEFTVKFMKDNFNLSISSDWYSSTTSNDGGGNN